MWVGWASALRGMLFEWFSICRMGPSLVMRNWSTERVTEGPPA